MTAKYITRNFMRKIKYRKAKVLVDSITGKPIMLLDNPQMRKIGKQARAMGKKFRKAFDNK